MMQCLCLTRGPDTYKAVRKNQTSDVIFIVFTPAFDLNKAMFF